MPGSSFQPWNTLKRAMQEEGKIMVVDYWKLASEATIWNNWIYREQWHTPAGPRNVELLLQGLYKIRVLKSNKEDILIWGSNPKDTFNLKEAYKLLATSPDQQSDHKWKTQWRRGTWQKITLFSWLDVNNRLSHGKTLETRFYRPLSMYALREWCRNVQSPAQYLSHSFLSLG